MKIRLTLIIFALIISFSINNNTFANNLQPSNVEAGAINKNIEKDANSILNINSINKPEKEIDKEKKKDNNNTFENKLNDIKRIDGTVEKTGFVLKQIEFSGNTAYSNEDLNDLISKSLGEYLEIGDLKNIIRIISEHYNENGYITSFAYLPPQKIKNGILKVNIVEGKISKIEIQGNKWVKTGFIKNNVLKAEGLKENKIFNVNDLRKSLGKINEMNYLKGRVTLQKAEDNESAEIRVDINDRAPVQFTAGYDNKGRDLIGVQRGVLTAGYENITGFGDRIYATNIIAKDTYGLNTNYFLPLGSYGTELRLGYGYSDVNLGKDWKANGIKGKAHGFNVGLIQPIYEKNTFKLTSDVTLDMLHVSTVQRMNNTFDKYDVRALRTALNAIKDDSAGRWVSRLEVSTGLPGLGGTVEHINRRGTSRFVRINPSIVRVQLLPYNTTGIFKLSGQYSPNQLLIVEQFGLGGMETVRGYKEGINYGDMGYFLNLELRKPIPFIKDIRIPYKKDKVATIPLKNRVQLALFYDQGMTKSKGINTNYKNFLQSLGFGLRINLAKYMHANLDFGIPLGRERTGDQTGMRFHFNITSDLI